MQDGVGVTEIANFAKYEVTGAGARAWLEHLMTNTMPRLGRLVLTPMLNNNGKLIGDFTIACAEAERFVIWGSSGAQIYHMRWFEQHLPSDGSVRLQRFGQTLVGVSIAGPKSRELLASLCDFDVSKDTLRFMDYREVDVAGCPCRLNRISYTGDLGFEIWMDPCYQRRVYTEIKRLGKPLGIVDFGMRALLSMRLEKNFPTWFAELRPIYGPFEADMGRFIKLDKGDFIGRAAAAEELKQGPKLSRVTLVIDADNTDVMGDEPVWAKIGDTDPGCIDEPHGYGASRFDAEGQEISKPDAIRDGDWRVVGWVTSGGYGHRVEASLAQAYLPSSLLDTPTQYEVEILGKRYQASVTREALFDPTGARMRS